MKQLTNYQRVSQYLVKVFKILNAEYFDGALEIPTITIQSSANSYAHVSVNKVWHNKDTATHELNLSADYMNRSIEDVVATLLHEACHLYAMQNNIKDCSNRGIYHNRNFKEIAEARGLRISRHEKYGWTITEPTEETINFCVKYGLEDIQLVRESPFMVRVPGEKSGDGVPIRRPRRPSSTRKYICPCCGLSFRATRSLNVLCMDCEEQFVVAL